MRKKLRSLIAAVVAAACLYTPTAVAEPNVFENLGTDSMSQVNDPSDVEESLGPEGSETSDEADAASGNDGEPIGESGDTAQPNAGDNGVPSGGEGNEVHSGEGDGANMLPESESGAVDAEQPESETTTPETDAPQPVAQDWTDDADNLTFATTGLTITPDQTVAGSESDGLRSDRDEADIAGRSVIPDGLNGSGVARGDGGVTALGGGLPVAATPTGDDAAAVSSGEETTPQLPETIEATLNLTFTLDAAASEGRADGSGAGVIVSGDTFSVTLPEGVEAADDGATFDVFACDADGNKTTTRVAEGKVSGDTLTVTFAEPVDTATGEPVEVTASVRASIDLPVRMDASLVKDEAGAIDWTVRQVRDTVQALTADSGDGNDAAGDDAAGDETRPDVLQLPIPAKADVLKTLGLTGAAEADETSRPESDSDKNSDSTNEALANGTNAPAGTTTETKIGPFDTQVHSQTIWCDNNSGNRPEPDELKDGYIPQYSLDGGKTYHDLVDANGKVTAEAQTDLHLTDYDVNRIQGSDLIQITRSATNTYSVITSALPGTIVTTTTTPILDDQGDPIFDENGQQRFETATTSKPITWQLRDTNEYPGYMSGEKSAWNKQYKMLTTEIEFNVVGKVGDKVLKDIFGNDEAEDFQFGASIDNKDQGSDSVADAIADGWLHIEDTDTGCVIKGTLPMYDEQGYPIVYYVKYAGADSGADYYQASYDNSASVNHGSANDAVYTGGTMTLRHAGTTTFSGSKVWLDGDNQADRPAVTYTLWRYSTQGSPETASQVSLASLQAENPDAPTPNTTGFIEVSAREGSGDLDLHQLLVDEYGESLIESLPKYDPDGYPYIYCMREEPVSGYEQVFGTVGENGKVSDTLPRYENEEGTGWVDVKRESRPDTDRFIYNGGTLSNRLTGTTSTQMTKTWEIAAFQDSLQNVVCEFTAQSRPKGSTDEGAWQDVNADNAVQTLTAWNAETLSKTLSQSFPKYDAHGTELEYRWIESNVTVDGQNTGFTRNDDGAASFTVSVAAGEDGTEELKFTSTPETVRNDDGSFSTTIVNTFENVTDQHVDKYWEQADGTQAQIAPDPAYSDGNATVELFQDGELIGSFTMDGKTDAKATGIDKLDGATWQETRSYHIDFKGLPKYSPEGKRYTYLVLETSKDGWATERTYDPETRTTRIDNYFPEGEGSEIRVTKKWIDGDDAEHRYKVEVTLYAAHDMASQTKDADGSPLYSYKKDEPVKEGVVLSEDEQWFTEVDVPIGGLTYKDFYARETALVAEDGTSYPVVTIDEAKAQYPDEAWVNAGWTNPENRRVATPEHVYEVRYQGNDTLQSLEVTNRRLGLFDLTVAKTWNDALGTDEGGVRPDATMTLSCDEYGKAFSLDDDGTLRVSVSGNSLPVTVTDEAGNPIKVTIVDADGKPADAGSVRIDIDKTKTNATYTFEGMPKYDADGMNVHYSVNEAWTGKHGDYYSTKTVGDYVVEPNARHFQDHQQVDFANSRSGSRDVVFYKEWHDNYVSEELNQRPDIYLTLYRVSANQTEPEAVPGYIHANWSSLSGDDDAADEQKVTISDLPKYDPQGAEYVYYASESMSADGDSLGYDSVRFSYGSIGEADEKAEADAKGALVAQGAENAVKVGDAESDDPQENGTGWAIREDGTFVNRLGGNLVAQGTKLWENIPGIVSQDATDASAQGDLPEVTIYLQQKLASDDGWPAAYAKQDADGTWKVTGTVAATSDLVQTTINQYTYTIDADYDGDPLLRYNENGDRYEYRAIEIIWGLLDQPGGFTANDLDGLDLAEVREGDGTSLVGAVYVIQHGETGSFLLRNVYGGTEKGKLTVKKLVAGPETDDEYPDVTFELWRYYQGYQGVADATSPAELVATQTISGSDLKSGKNTTTFDDLDVYAPDGSRWIYFVAERSIGGYTTTVGNADIDSVQDKRLGSRDMIDGSGVVVEKDGVAMRSEDLGGADETVIADDEDVDVTFANAYEPGSTSLAGTKTWSDYDNIFSVRPDAIDLTFTRTAGGMKEDVEVQSNDPDEANYLNWTAQGKEGDWTFTLANIEQWAPNGQAWEYHVTEALPDGTDSYYTIATGSSSATAGTSDSFRLENALNGKATVEKEWVDGGDPYGLRPETVTVQLQAHYRTAATDDATEGQWTGWTSAYDVWKQFASEDDLTSQQFTEAYTKRELSDANGWRASWSRLPVLARTSVDSTLCDIEYRVVEIKIGDLEVTPPADNNGNYSGTTGSYQPSQKPADAINSFGTKITNTLQGTEISATKTWQGDAADAWGTRPGNGNIWTATYFLQSSTDSGTSWQWVVEAGSEADPNGSASQDGVVKVTISNGMVMDGNHEVSVDGNGATVTWKNLPGYNAEGTKYQYRVVEQVPGSYDVEGTKVEQVPDTDTAHRYYVVSSSAGATDDDPSNQSYTNDLRTVDLTGTKLWEDFGTGIAPEFDASKVPTMTLYRAVENGDGTWGTAEQVKMKDGSAAAQPKWAEGADGAWTFTYEDLPAADKNDKPYTYWAVETAGSGGMGGFYPVYGSDGQQSSATYGAAGTTVETPAFADTDGKQTNETITNVATKLALDKVSDCHGVGGADDPEQLAGIQLAVQSRDGKTTYATWTNGVNGETYSTYTWVNGTTDPSNTADAVLRTDNLIVGLKAGQYRLVETGTPPAGYAQAPDVLFTINADGTAQYDGVELDGVASPSQGEAGVAVDTDAGIHTITVTAEDPVLRGHLELTKYVSEDGTTTGENAEALEGATFDLYRVDMDGDGKDELIASGLTTDANGKITTVGNDAAISIWSSKGEQGGGTDLTYGGKYVTLADGLPEGNYYFVETDAGSTAVTPSGDDAKTDTLTIDQEHHYAYTGAVSSAKANESFTSTVELIKYDTTSLAGINGAEFSLKYRPEGTSGSDYPVDLGTFTTAHDATLDKDGVLVLDNLEKGDYLLTETKNDGYDIADGNAFQATFTIDNADNDHTYLIWADDDEGRTEVDFTVLSGKIDHGAGIPNNRLTGQATLAKRGGDNAYINATFDLQVKQDDGTWKTLVTDLSTANSYELTWSADGTSATAADTGDIEKGRLTVTGLTWSTYRFVETATTPGYVPEDANGALVSSEFPIARGTTNVSASVTVRNEPTNLELNKSSEVGEALDGAVFTVTPVNGSTFADPAALGNAYDAATGAVRLTTSNGGHATLTAQLVVGGTYDIYEAQAPTGYDPVDTKFQVTVANDGSLEVVDGDTALENTGWSRADLDRDGQADDAFSFTAVNNHLAVKLTKVSSSNPDLALEGVTFRLTGQVMNDNDTTHTYTTDEDGVISIDDGLMGGVDYTLTEDTTHPGYIQHTEPLKFRMNMRGEIEVTGDAPEGWSVNADKISFTVKNDSVDLQITKHDPEGKALFGAVFSVTPVNGSTFADGSTDTVEYRTRTDGTLFMGAKLMVGGTYDITEVSAPEGYEKVPGIMRVTVGEDGAINVVGSVDENGKELSKTEPTGYDKVDTNAFEVQVVNQPVEITIDKVSAADGGTHLDGAVFEVTGVFADKRDEETREYTTASDGTLVGISNISAELKSGQTYTLREKTAPAGYELIEGELTFAVAEDGTVSAVGDVPAGYSISTDKVSIVASDTPIEVLFEKRGLTDDGDLLSGGEFTISGTFVNDATHETSQQEIPFTTGSDATVIGKLSHDGATYSLVAGQTYTVTESEAPAGYEKLPTFSFTVDEHGAITAADGSTTAGVGEPGYAISTEGGTVTLTAHDRSIEVTLAKTGSDTDGALLDGAVFELSRIDQTADGEVLDSLGEVKSESNGAVSLAGLVTGGTYVLHEKTAPEGYELMNDVRFTVAEDGTVALVNNAPEGWTLVNGEDGVSALTASDAPIEARLVKTDGTGAPLAGAGFEIKPQDGSRFAGSPALNDDGALEVGPSGEDGIVQIPAGVLVAGNTYELVEITAPAGYELAGTARFTVHADGTISIKDAADGEPFAPTDGSGAYTTSADGGTAVITAQDAPIEIELKKRAEGKNGKALAGAVFNVTPADGSSFVDDALNDPGIPLAASADDGTVDTAALDAQLIAGSSYVIEEVTPPAGYEQITGTLTFTVNADGTIAETAGAANDSAFAIDATDDVVTIAATDRPVEVTLNKVSSEDPDAKLDATFTLKGVFAAEALDGTADATETTRTIKVNGTITLDRLVVGNTYVLQETKSQAGYEVIAGTLTFTVNADGTVTAVTADGNGAAIVNDPAFGEVENAEQITAADTPVRITVAKVDEDSQPLEGAEFTLTGDFVKPDGTVEADHTWRGIKPGTSPATVEGLIVTNGSDRHEYTLTETKAPAGYETLGGVTFTINPDGTIAGEGAGYTVDGNGVNVTAQDTAIKARLMKTDENGQPQAGATFRIQATLGGTFSDGSESKQFTTGADGFVDLDEHWFVGGNSYVIEEVTAPGGYELAGAATFTVNTDGSITFHDDADRPTQAIVHGRGGSGTYQASSTADGVAVITASNSPIAVQLTKVGDATPLAGATFELTPAPGSTFADGSDEAQPVVFTGADVTALANLKAGATYTLKETVPPAGYELNPTEFTFTVNADGTITPTEAEGYTVTGDEIVTITANDEPIEVTLTKRNAAGDALEGAEFTLHGEFANADGTPSGTEADRTVEVENGSVTLTGLIAGREYTLVETKAPEGYRVNTGTLTFAVNADGTLTEIESAEGYAIEADATAITVTDQPTELDLTKLAADGTPLVGAEFTLAPDTEHDADSRFVSGRSSIDLIVGEDGTVPTITGELIAGHAYVLTETKAPDGYALITESLHFTVGRKGRAASVTAGTELPDGYTIGGDKTAGTIALTAVDQPIELTLKKVNEGGDALVGAEFTLSGRFADGTTQQILTTGADGTVALPLIIGGERYVLEETKAPEGYVLPAERYTFTVGVDGVIRVQQNLLAALLPGDKTFSLSEDGLTITVVNEREPVVAITGSDVTSVGFIGFGLLLIGAAIAMQRRTRMAQVAGNGKPARGRHRR